MLKNKKVSNNKCRSSIAGVRLLTNILITEITQTDQLIDKRNNRRSYQQLANFEKKNSENEAIDSSLKFGIFSLISLFKLSIYKLFET